MTIDFALQIARGETYIQTVDEVDYEREAKDVIFNAIRNGTLLNSDCISRQDAIKEFQSYREYNSNRTNNEWVDRIEGVLKLLPPVMPQTVTEFADKCKECGSIKEDLYEKGFEAGKHYILEGRK